MISTALDNEPTDAQQLDEAKAHCKTCPECGAFVRAQFVARKAPLPQAPDDLADRVMARIRADADATAHAEEAARARAAQLAESRTAPVVTLAVPQSSRKVPRAWVSAAAAAAVILALVGTSAIVVAGLREMSGESAAKSTAVVGSADSLPQTAPVPSNRAGAVAGAPKTSGSVQVAGAQSIAVNGIVYKLAGPATLATATAAVAGATNTALDTASPPRRRDVWAGPTADSVYIADDSGAVFSFNRVTRTYAGLTFALTSTELTSYSQWPALPSQITAPTSADGQPTFAFDGTDSTGVRIYRLANSSATQGIAIAPNSPHTDPAGGNPNWTWWTVAR